MPTRGDDRGDAPPRTADAAASSTTAPPAARRAVRGARGGAVEIVTIPRPAPGPTEVLVATACSLVSAGTERSLAALGAKGLVAKARARPDLAREVVRHARSDGLRATARVVRDRLDADLVPGSSAAGVALEVGEAVPGIVPGMLVATGGGPHGDLQLVPGLLAAPVPTGVPAGDAAFAAFGAIALNGLRLAGATVGSRVVVVGLGLLGQLAVRLAHAAGCIVAGIDPDPQAVARARDAGAFAVAAGPDADRTILDWSDGHGADAVVVTAADPSSHAVTHAIAMARDRATVCVVGEVGLDLDRRALYDKELRLTVAHSFGPGRDDPAYESLGIDYPAGLVPFTARRNLESVLALLASGRLTVADLVTHRFDFDDALAAYELLDRGDEPRIAIAFSYPTSPDATGHGRAATGSTESSGSRDAAGPDTARDAAGAAPTPAPGTAAGASRRLGTGPARLGVIGPGRFARATLLPALERAGLGPVTAVASAGGRSASRLASSTGARVAPDAVSLIEDADVDVVVVATPHGTHAELTAAALRAGKHVFCEKPLALREDELHDVVAAWEGSDTLLMVGFNRRWSPALGAARDHLDGSGPLTIGYHVDAGPVDGDHWYHDRRNGGRLLGEVCHFVDTCAALVGEPIESVVAMGGGRGELLLTDDVVVSLRFADGSLASIAYGAGGRGSGAKERIAIAGRGHTVVIDGWRSVAVDGRKAWRATGADKGFDAEAAALARALRSGTGCATREAFATTAAVLAAAASLRTGAAVRPIGR